MKKFATAPQPWVRVSPIMESKGSTLEVPSNWGFAVSFFNLRDDNKCWIQITVTLFITCNVGGDDCWWLACWWGHLIHALTSLLKKIVLKKSMVVLNFVPTNLFKCHLLCDSDQGHGYFEGDIPEAYLSADVEFQSPYAEQILENFQPAGHSSTRDFHQEIAMGVVFLTVGVALFVANRFWKRFMKDDDSDEPVNGLVDDYSKHEHATAVQIEKLPPIAKADSMPKSTFIARWIGLPVFSFFFSLIGNLVP